MVHASINRGKASPEPNPKQTKTKVKPRFEIAPVVRQRPKKQIKIGPMLFPTSLMSENKEVKIR